MKSQGLSDIIRGIQNAASSTNAMLIQQFIHLMDHFFDTDKDGKKIARTVTLQSSTMPGYSHEIPLLALIRPSSLILKKLVVDMSVRITEAEVKEESNGLHNAKPTRSSFQVEIGPRPSGGIVDKLLRKAGRSSDVTDIRMVFESSEAPEAVSRLIDDYANSIQPKKSQ